jgi:flagellin
LKGDGKTSIASTGITGVSCRLGVASIGTVGADAYKTQAIDGKIVTGDISALANGNTVTNIINGQVLTATFVTANASLGTGGQVYAVDDDSANINLGTAIANTNAGRTVVSNGIKDALQEMIDANDTLKGQYKVSVQGTNNDKVVIEAVEDGTFDGAAGSISAAATLTTATYVNDAAITAAGTNVAVTKEIDLSGYTTKASVEALVGKGMTINDTHVEFYDASKGAYMVQQKV